MVANPNEPFKSRKILVGRAPQINIFLGPDPEPDPKKAKSLDPGPDPDPLASDSDPVVFKAIFGSLCVHKLRRERCFDYLLTTIRE